MMRSATPARKCAYARREMCDGARIGWGKSRAARRMFDSPKVRDWFYHRGRSGAVPKLDRLDGARVTVTGDALAPGKTREAIESAYRAAFFESTP